MCDQQKLNESMVKRLAQAALQLAYPPTCAFCYQGLADQVLAANRRATISAGLCQACRSNLFSENHNPCPRCGYPNHYPATPASAGCMHCCKLQLRFDRTTALGPYIGALRQAVLRMKEPGGDRLAISIGKQLASRTFECRDPDSIDLIVPIPSHWTRRWGRGHNVAEIIAEQIAAKAAELQVAEVQAGEANSSKFKQINQSGSGQLCRLLKIARRMKKQSTLHITKRRQNVRGAFETRKGYQIDGARILLVDDVMTTGSTLTEAARICRNVGAHSVDVAIVARALGY